MAQPEPTDRPLTRYVRPHEADTSDIVLRQGERLPAGAVKRALDALVACTASLQDAGGRFIAVRPQPARAREALESFLESVLDAEVPGRAEIIAVPELPTDDEIMPRVSPQTRKRLVAEDLSSESLLRAAEKARSLGQSLGKSTTVPGTSMGFTAPALSGRFEEDFQKTFGERPRFEAPAAPDETPY